MLCDPELAAFTIASLFNVLCVILFSLIRDSLFKHCDAKFIFESVKTEEC